jgi:hypothetical protein
VHLPLARHAPQENKTCISVRICAPIQHQTAMLLR